MPFSVSEENIREKGGMLLNRKLLLSMENPIFGVISRAETDCAEGGLSARKGTKNMGDLRWIKIATDIFEDEKMLVIESRPDGNKVMLIWFKLLCLAGKKSGTGVFTIGGKPYTDELFSIVFRRPVKEVREALDLFESLGMITREDGVVAIKNWTKHQSVDELERVRAQTRARVAKHREKQKIQAAEMENSAPKNADVTQCNGECNAIEKNREDKSRIEENRVDESRIEENRVDESRAAESRSDESNVSSPSASRPPHTAAEKENDGFADRGYAFGEVADRCSEGILRPGIPVTDEYDEADIPPEDDGWFFAPPPRKDYYPDGCSLTREYESARPSFGEDDCAQRGEAENLFPPQNSYEPRKFTEKTDSDRGYEPWKEQREQTLADELKQIPGKGRGVIMLTDEQISSLEERLGYDTYQGYLDRLSSFIIEKRAKIKNHYETILKWYEEDKKDGTAAARERGNKAVEKEKNSHRQGNFDYDEAFRYALARSNARIEET